MKNRVKKSLFALILAGAVAFSSVPVSVAAEEPANESNNEVYNPSLEVNQGTVSGNDAGATTHTCEFVVAFDENTHKEVCSCGKEQNEEEHALSLVGKESEGVYTHAYTCSACGYESEASACSGQIRDNQDDETHSLVCVDCGQVLSTEEHNYDDENYSFDEETNTIAYTCSECPSLFWERHTQQEMSQDTLPMAMEPTSLPTKMEALPQKPARCLMVFARSVDMLQ